MSVTISEIADQLGVSPMTVSRALRGVGRIGAETRERVLAAARACGYRPNLSARAMRSGRFGCVALVVGAQAVSRGVSHELLWGIEEALEAKGLYLAVTRLPDEHLAAEGRIPQILSQWMTDGLLINGALPIPTAIVEQIEKQQVPSIWINEKRAADCVYADDLDAGRRGTEYLLSLGHRRIAYADYNLYDAWNIPSVHLSARDRYGGYVQAMRAAGSEVVAWDAAASQDQRVAYSREKLSAADRPTAVITCNYRQTAAQILSAAASLGLRLPHDFSLVTIEESPVTEWDLQIATMVVPDREMGRASVQMLLQKLAGPSAELPRRVLRMELVTGNSCLPFKQTPLRPKLRKQAAGR